MRGAITGLDETARTLRHELTPAEKKLWNAIRNRQLDGLKFRRQHPVGRFILDFFCAELRLVIELDGAIHDGQIAHDAERSRMLNEFGYVVLRFRNDEVFSDLAGVLEKIRSVALTPRPPLPILGEGANGNDIEYSIEFRNYETAKPLTNATKCAQLSPLPISGEGPGVRAND